METYSEAIKSLTIDSGSILAVDFRRGYRAALVAAADVAAEADDEIRKLKRRVKNLESQLAEADAEVLRLEAELNEVES